MNQSLIVSDVAVTQESFSAAYDIIAARKETAGKPFPVNKSFLTEAGYHTPDGKVWKLTEPAAQQLLGKYAHLSAKEVSGFYGGKLLPDYLDMANKGLAQHAPSFEVLPITWANDGLGHQDILAALPTAKYQYYPQLQFMDSIGKLGMAASTIKISQALIQVILDKEEIVVNGDQFKFGPQFRTGYGVATSAALYFLRLVCANGACVEEGENAIRHIHRGDAEFDFVHDAEIVLGHIGDTQRRIEKLAQLPANDLRLTTGDLVLNAVGTKKAREIFDKAQGGQYKTAYEYWNDCTFQQHQLKSFDKKLGVERLGGAMLGRVPSALTLN